MAVVKAETWPVRSETDILVVRQAVRTRSVELGLSLVDQTKMVTAASEIVRNALIYGGGGDAEIQVLDQNGRRGLRLICVDQGPGIPDVELAMKDGYTTGHGLGLGLGGAKRLVNDFEIASRPGEGTRVALTRWK